MNDPKEWSVKCTWCDAKPGQPCRDLKNQDYLPTTGKPAYIHLPRYRLYWSKQGKGR